MRLLSVVIAGLLVATASYGDVRITVKADGRKVIYNDARSRPGGSNLEWWARQHDRPSKYDSIIERYATEYGVNPTLIRAVIQVESDFNPNCVSNKGARGLMQLMPATAKRFGVTEVHDPEQNILGGVRYLAYLTRLFNEDLTRVFAGYNAGENAVLKYGGIPPFAETTEYVRRAMTVYYGRPHRSGGIWFSGRPDGAVLKGGFGGSDVQPAALIPGAKYLGSH